MLAFKDGEIWIMIYATRDEGWPNMTIIMSNHNIGQLQVTWYRRGTTKIKAKQENYLVRWFFSKRFGIRGHLCIRQLQENCHKIEDCVIINSESYCQLSCNVLYCRLLWYCLTIEILYIVRHRYSSCSHGMIERLKQYHISSRIIDGVDGVYVRQGR